MIYSSESDTYLINRSGIKRDQKRILTVITKDKRQRSTLALFLLLIWALISGCSSKGTRLDDSPGSLDRAAPEALSFRTLIKSYMYCVGGTAPEEDRSEIEAQFIETFKDSNETAIPLAQTEKIEFFAAGNGLIFAVYSVENGFFKYGVLFRPDQTPYKVILLGYRFGNNEFHVERSHHIERKEPLIIRITDKRYETLWTGEDPGKEGQKVLSYEESYAVILDSRGRLSCKKTGDGGR